MIVAWYTLVRRMEEILPKTPRVKLIMDRVIEGIMYMFHQRSSSIGRPIYALNDVNKHISLELQIDSKYIVMMMMNVDLAGPV